MFIVCGYNNGHRWVVDWTKNIQDALITRDRCRIESLGLPSDVTYEVHPVADNISLDWINGSATAG